MNRNATVTLIFNTIENYNKELQSVLNKHLDNLVFSSDEDKESFGLAAVRSFRTSLQNLIKGQEDEEAVLNLRSLLESLFHGVEVHKIKLSTVLLFIDDIFECLSVKSLRTIFEVLESYVGRLENVEANDQNTLLRITNTMLKRISKAQDIEFRGRLYIALSKMLKLCHESGLKNKSAAGSNVLLDDQEKFSLSTVTLSTVTYRFYKQFWSLQKYFNDPAELLNDTPDHDIMNPNEPVNELRLSTTKLKSIETIIANVIRIFTNNPARVEGQRGHQPIKYLTRARLIETQLNDSYFRKLFLTQALLFCFGIKNTTTKNPFTLRDNQKQIVNTIEKKVREGLAELSASLGEDPLSPKLDSLLQNERNWIDIKENLKERKKTLIQPPSTSTQEQLNYYRQNEQTTDDSKRNIYNELINPHCRKVYDRNNQLMQQMKDKMKTEGDNFKQFMEEIAKKRPLQTQPLLPSFEYYFNQAASALKNFEQKNSITQNFQTKSAYTVFEWKAMKSLYRQSMHDGLIDKKDNTKLKQYRLLSAVRKKEQQLRQDPQKKPKLD